MVEQTAIAQARRYGEELNRQAIPVRFLVLFGSYARGEQGPWSDMDIVVVSPHFDGEVRREDINILWRTAARTDSRIEPLPCGERQWEEDTSSAIIEIARREGYRISTE